MNFPLIPLPHFLLNWYPKLQEIHTGITEISAVIFGIIGLFIILLWAGENPKEELPFGGTVSGRLKLGFVLLGIAVFSCIFGLYLWVPIYTAFFVSVIYAVVSSARTVLFTKSQTPGNSVSN